MEGPFLYIVHTRECRRLNENVYKIGRTEQCVNRIRAYGRGSLLQLLVPVEDSKVAERKVIKEFKKHFVHKSYYGAEYFEGNLREMQNIMLSIAQYYSSVQNNNKIEKLEHEDNCEEEEIDKNVENYKNDETQKIYNENINIPNAGFLEITNHILDFFKKNNYVRMSDKTIRIKTENKVVFIDSLECMKTFKNNSPAEVEMPLRKKGLFKDCAKFIEIDAIIPQGEMSPGEISDLDQFVELYMEYTQNDNDWVTLKQIKDCVADSEFKNFIDTGRSIKNVFCDLFNTECIKQKRFGKSILKNVFLGWRLIHKIPPAEKALGEVENLKLFVDLYLEKDKCGWITLKEIKNAVIDSKFNSSIKTGHGLKEELVIVLDIECLPRKKIQQKSLKNVFIGWKLKIT
jgi:hypothetical protein